MVEGICGVPKKSPAGNPFYYRDGCSVCFDGGSGSDNIEPETTENGSDSLQHELAKGSEFSASLSDAKGTEFSTNRGDAKGVLNGVTAYVGQQLGDAGAARDDYNKKVTPLDPSDSEGRSKIKQETREKTPKLVSDFIKRNRPSTGAKPGTGGRANSTNPKANKIASALKYGGRGLLAVNLGMNAVDIAKSDNTGLALMRSAFGIAGGIGGGIVGAIGGSFVAPGPGTAVGGVTGAALGGAGGERLGEATYNFFWGRREDSTSN